MKNKTTIRLAIVACVTAVVLGLVAGCAGGQSLASSDAARANRAYMSQVNQIMDELGGNLDGFVDAVSRGDVVGMRSQAELAYATLDKLANLDAPEALADVKTKYVDGSKKLREALEGYITLYSDASAGTTTDKDAYNKRISELQSLYDEGVSLMQAADEAAAK